MNMLKDKSGRGLRNTEIALIAGGAIFLLIIIGLILFKVLSGVLCPECPACPEQIDPSDVQKIFSEVINPGTPLQMHNQLLTE